MTATAEPTLEGLCRRLQEAQLGALTDLATRAAADGWTHPLLCFVLAMDRLPTEEELRGIMMTANLHGMPTHGRA